MENNTFTLESERVKVSWHKARIEGLQNLALTRDSESRRGRRKTASKLPNKIL